MITLDSVIRVNKKYYPQRLLEECKYIIKNNKTENLINDDLDLSSSDNESDNEYNDESDNKFDNKSPLLKGIISNHKGDFYCLNCLYSFRKEKSLKSIKMYAKIMIIVM